MESARQSVMISKLNDDIFELNEVNREQNERITKLNDDVSQQHEYIMRLNNDLAKKTKDLSRLENEDDNSQMPEITSESNNTIIKPIYNCHKYSSSYFRDFS